MKKSRLFVICLIGLFVFASLWVGQIAVTLADSSHSKLPLNSDSYLSSMVTISETFKLTSTQPIVDGRYGRAVAIYGDTLIVGETKGELNVNLPGILFIHERHTGGPNNWGITKILTPSDGTAGHSLGTSLSFDGDTILAGAGTAFGNTNESGAAYIFERNAGGSNNWGEVAKLIAPDGAFEDRFGWSVSLDGDTVVVGARWHDSGGFNRGAAYIYGRNVGGANNWGLIKKITASNPATSDRFGVSVAVSGDTVVVGADGKGIDTGLVYIFERNAGGPDNWGEVLQIAPDLPLSNDLFGVEVAIAGDLIAVGATEKDTPRPGAVYLFERNAGGPNNWGQIAKLTASDGNANDRLGISLSLRGDTLVAGAHHAMGVVSNSGAAYVFKQDVTNPSQWGETEKLIASDGAGNDQFGVEVGFFGDTFAVGAFFNDDYCPANPNCDSGAAYLFTPILPTDVSIEKHVLNTTAVPGQPLTYTLTFTNNGPDIAFGTIITDLIPNTILNPTYTNSGALITPTGGAPFVWQVADLAPGEGGAITITGIINPDLISETLIVNTAVITNSLDITPTNNIDTAVTQILMPEINLNPADYVVNEDVGVVMVTAVLSPAQPFLDVMIDYQTMDDTALAGEDYTAVSGTLTFPAGATIAQFTIPIVDDGLVEPTEIFQLTLSNPIHALMGNVTTGTVTIVDEDSPPLVSLSGNAYLVPEDIGQATITVTLDHAYLEPVSVEFVTTNGTALAGADYTAVAGTLTLTAGVRQTTFTIPITDDMMVEPNETFTVTLSNPVNATINPTTNVASVTILDNDKPLTEANLIYLPFIARADDAPPEPDFPIFINNAIVPRPVMMQGEVFFTTTIMIPTDLPATGQFFLSSQPNQLEAISVDDELVLLHDDNEIFTKRFSLDGQTIHPEIVGLPRSLLEPLAGESVVVMYRDVFSDQVSATAVWLLYIP